MIRGKFITFEGPEGAGKSSAISHINEMLGALYPLLLTKEPGSPLDPFCTQLRKLNLDPANEIDTQAEIFLYLADRAQHVNRVILPALKQRQHVICDRYIDSTIAYQGYGRGSNVEKLRWLNDYATSSLVPDLTIILLVEPKIGLSRATRNEFNGPDRLEKEALAFHQRVREGYLAIAEHHHDRKIALIDTTGLSLNATCQKALDLVTKCLKG